MLRGGSMRRDSGSHVDPSRDTIISPSPEISPLSSPRGKRSSVSLRDVQSASPNPTPAETASSDLTALAADTDVIQLLREAKCPDIESASPSSSGLASLGSFNAGQGPSGSFRRGSFGSSGAVQALPTESPLSPTQLKKTGPTVELYRYKVCLVGNPEAGKSSLKKCFESHPFFFKNLPQVDCTVGIDSSVFTRKMDRGNTMSVQLMDLAGQEIYHGHSAFMGCRTLYVFTWDMSKLEVESGGMSFGITQDDSKRFRYWLDEVQARAPGSTIAVVGTHKDMLRDKSQRSVEFILQKVHKAVDKIVQDMYNSLPASVPKELKTVPTICATFCVSCKDRTCVSENRGGPETIPQLFDFLVDVCLKNAKTEKKFPARIVPAYVPKVINVLKRLQKLRVFLLSMHQYNRLLFHLQVVDRVQLQNLTRLLHDWGELYLFDRQATRIGRHDCVFLNPSWLALMCAAVFSYAHASQAPPHERARLAGISIDVGLCQKADCRNLMSKGILSLTLAGAIFTRPLYALNLQCSIPNIMMCLTLLQNIDLIYKFDTAWIHDTLEGTEEDERINCVKEPLYFVPSLFPNRLPIGLFKLMRSLLSRVGVRRVYKLVPFPVEFFAALHCRVPNMVVRIGHSYNWTNGMWIGAGGGGDGNAYGVGPMRGIVNYFRDLREVHVYFYSPRESNRHGASVEDFVDAFSQNFADLASKYKGVHQQVCVPCNRCGSLYDVADLKKKAPRHAPPNPQPVLTDCPECFPVAQHVAGNAPRSKEQKATLDYWLYGGLPPLERPELQHLTGSTAGSDADDASNNASDTEHREPNTDAVALGYTRVVPSKAMGFTSWQRIASLLGDDAHGLAKALAFDSYNDASGKPNPINKDADEIRVAPVLDILATLEGDPANNECMSPRN